ncbi:hypothetical protein [Nocardia brevicatena]|uniref:hypothetical protein n=1 Tax=Nocardia brevicatena TaxID=37327 RepID=UPI0002DD8586|nr:hypothetical protein [Nocardia brevicatena]
MNHALTGLPIRVPMRSQAVQTAMTLWAAVGTCVEIDGCRDRVLMENVVAGLRNLDTTRPEGVSA